MSEIRQCDIVKIHAYNAQARPMLCELFAHYCGEFLLSGRCEADSRSPGGVQEEGDQGGRPGAQTVVGKQRVLELVLTDHVL